jgi:hypothetical protein
MILKANINGSMPIGPKIVQESRKNTKVLQNSYNQVIEGVDVVRESMTWDDVKKHMWDKLEDHYGIDLRTL